jgi:DNA-binding MarR family transcriptional regulator
MSHQGPGVAFLLAQVGAAATAGFASALEPLGLTPAQAGLLRLVQSSAGARSQQELAARLGAAPSRVVGLLDDLEGRGIITRRPGPDRRVNLVTLTDAGHRLLAELNTAARAHDDAVTATLTAQQRDQLQALLSTIAKHLDLPTGVHPGYGDQPRVDRRTGDGRTSAK